MRQDATEPALRRVAVNDRGFEVACWEWGSGDEVLLGLHGGPGLDHRYISGVASIASDELRVVLYDQLGGGQSDRPDDDSLWTMGRFVEEVERVRAALGVRAVHLYGQSWGGWLALQYVLGHPDAVKSLILSNTSASIADTFKDMQRQREALPAAKYATLMRHEAEGKLDDSAYQRVVNELYATYFRRSTPFELQRSLEEYREYEYLFSDVGRPFVVMWGQHEFVCTGNLIEWDVTDQLHTISQPTLILGGWYDHVGLSVQRAMAERIPSNEFVILGHASHLPMLEREADVYFAVIRDFLARVRNAA